MGDRRPAVCALFSSRSEGLVVYQGEPRNYLICPSLPLPFQDAIRRLGGLVCDGEKVTDIKPGRPVTVRSASRTYRAKSLIITAGPWTNRLLRPLGMELPLQVRGG